MALYVFEGGTRFSEDFRLSEVAFMEGWPAIRGDVYEGSTVIQHSHPIAKYIIL